MFNRLPNYKFNNINYKNTLKELLNILYANVLVINTKNAHLLLKYHVCS